MNSSETAATTGTATVLGRTRSPASLNGTLFETPGRAAVFASAATSSAEQHGARQSRGRRGNLRLGNAIVEQNVIQNNGGVGYPSVGYSLVHDNTVRDNAGEGDHSRKVSLMIPTILRNTIEHNKGGGIVFISMGDPVSSTISFETTPARQDGAGIFIHDGGPLSRRTPSISNTVLAMAQGQPTSGGTITWRSPTITRNVITRDTLIPCPVRHGSWRRRRCLQLGVVVLIITNNIIANNSVLGADGDVAGGGFYVYAGRPQVLHQRHREQLIVDNRARLTPVVAESISAMAKSTTGIRAAISRVILSFATTSSRNMLWRATAMAAGSSAKQPRCTRP